MLLPVLRSIAVSITIAGSYALDRRKSPPILLIFDVLMYSIEQRRLIYVEAEVHNNMLLEAS